ncbi:MAG: hypothetical protein P8X79_19960, partial [Reinekea sp.]
MLTAVDGAGNHTELQQIFSADVTPPQFSQWHVPSLTNKETVAVSVLVFDQYSGVEQVRLLVNDQPVPVTLTSATSATTGSQLVNATVALTEGTNNLAFSATDVLGNRVTNTFAINRDSTAPVLSLAEPASPWQLDAQYQLTGTVTDDNAGIASVSLGSEQLLVADDRFTSVQTLVDGLNQMTVKARDLAGNVSEATIEVGRDQLAPELTLDQSSTLVTNDRHWHISGHATDAHSGVARLVAQFADANEQPIPVVDGAFDTVLTLPEGKSTGELILTDQVGLSARQALTTLLDQTAPVIALAYNGSALTEATSLFIDQPDLVVDLAVQDDSAGLASIEVLLNGARIPTTVTSTTLALTLANGTNALSVTAIDNAGNQSQQAIQLTLDQTPPTITWLSDTDPTNNPDMAVMWQVTDASGIREQQLTLNGQAVTWQPSNDDFEATVTLNEGQNTLIVSAIDLAGNTTQQTFTRQLDTQAPTLTLASLPATTAQNTIKLSGQVQDALPVQVTINRQAVTVDEQGAFSALVALTEGSNSIAIQASDALGNLTQQSATLISDQSGPVITASVPPTVDDNTVTVTGQISDALSNIQSVRVLNATTGIPYSVDLSGDQFSVAVILDDGVNTLSVEAEDTLGNQSSLSLQTEVLVSGLQWQWQSATNLQTEAADIVLDGLLTTDLPDSEFTVTIAGQATTVSPWSDGLYSVRSARLALTEGINSVEVIVTANNSELRDSLLVERLVNTEPPSDTPFELTINSPANGLQINGEYLTLSGEVRADSTPEVTINGEPATLATSVPYYRFSTTLNVPQGQAEWTLNVSAQLADGRQLSEHRRVFLDTQAPVIALNNALRPYPEATLILDNPYVLTGRVEDANFNSLTLNGNLLEVTPAGNDQYQFRTAVSLPNNSDTTVTLIAQDRAGNRTAQSYVLQARRTLELKWLLPLQNSQLLSYGDPFDVQIVLQSSEQTSSHRYQIRLVNTDTQTAESWQTLTFNKGTASTDLTLRGATGQFALEARVIDTNNALVASLPVRTLTVSTPQTVPVELSKVQPEQGAQNVDTKESISLFFNQPIDPNLLDIQVFETAFGKTWLNQDASGTEFFNAKGHQLVEVQRDHEVLPVTWQLVSDDKT